MNKQIMIIETDGESVIAKHYNEGKVATRQIDARKADGDFLFACAYLIDDMASPPMATRLFNGKAICCESRIDEFEIGVVYDWVEGYPINPKGTCTQRPITAANIECGLIKCNKVKFVIIKG